MPFRSEAYLEKAEDCEKRALSAESPNIRFELLRIGAEWRVLAAAATSLDAIERAMGDQHKSN